MKRTLLAIIIFCSLLIPFASPNAENLYVCIDSQGNKILTSCPRDGMNNCVLKDSYTDHSQKERTQQQKKSQKSRQSYKRESEAAEKESTAREQEEAALIREGNRCYTQVTKILSGGRLSDVHYWRICVDKKGNAISSRRLRVD